MPMVRIGEALLALGFITPLQLDDALAQQRRDRGVPLGELLVRRGDVSRQDLQTALARKMGYPMVDVTQFPADLEAVARLPYPVANRLRTLPLMQRAGRLIVAMEDPSRGDVMEELEFAAQGKVVPVLGRAAQLHGAIDRAYEKMGTAVFTPRLPDPASGVDFDLDNAKGLLATLEQQHTVEQRSHGDEEASIEQSDNSLVRLINSMIIEAHGQGVSDIHIECQPGREKVRIRFRRDGQLKPYLELPHTYRSALMSRSHMIFSLATSASSCRARSSNCGWPPSPPRTTSKTPCCGCWPRPGRFRWTA
jgi:Type II secretion system (T2SS), protein E, N-terminal domain